MSQEQLKSACVKAFKKGNKQDAEQLIPLIEQPAELTTDVWFAELTTLLHLAAHHGWMDIIIDLISKYKCDTNYKDKNGCTPLHYAVRNNHLEVVRYLINEQHDSINSQDKYGDTPLNYACRNGHLDIAQYLISEAHCDPSFKNKNGDTPLHIACHNNRLRIVQHLLSTGKVDPLIKNKNGDTPLHIACRNDCLHIVQYLLSTGNVNPFAKNNRGRIPLYAVKVNQISYQLPILHMAAHHGWMDIIIDLITKYKCDTNCKDDHGRTTLHYAVRNNHLEVVKILNRYKQHDSINSQDNNGDTPLNYACRNGHLDIAQYLISEAHCDPSCEDSDGDTPLHIACHNNRLRIVQHLLSTGEVDPLIKNKNGDTPLHIACRNDCLHIVQYLLSTGNVNPFAKNNRGRIPLYAVKVNQISYQLPMLHLAAHHGWMDITFDLITKYKCDTNCKDDYGRSPVHYAVCNNHLEVVKILNRYKQHDSINSQDNNGDTPLHYACRIGHLDIAQYLISEALCDPSCKNNDGDTPLHTACHNDRLHVVQYLLSTGKVDPLIKNKNGDTPLHIACRNDRLHIVQYLLSTGNVNPFTKNNEGRIPLYAVKINQISYQLPMLHLAAHHGWMDIIIDLITKYKCDTNCKDGYGRTPLHYAVCLEVVRYFIFEQHCDPMNKDSFGNTPLHNACQYDHLHIVKYLLSTCKVNPFARNNEGEIPMYAVKINRTSYQLHVPMLHLAAHLGWMDIIIDLITKYKCDTNCKDDYGRTPLHYAVCNNHLEVVRYFINEQHCNPMNKDQFNDTPLHLACQSGHNHIVQYLLSTDKVDLLAKNKFHTTPVDYASRQDNSYDLLKLFQSFPQSKRDFPVHTYTKLILTGYSGAGKTTISQLIRLLANKASGFSVLSSGRVTNVECLTAGIIPLHVESKVNKLGNMVIYDFAGQQEYYSSHAAVLERIMKNSAAIFLCIVDLSQHMDKISESIHYWISFIENACSSAQESSHVIIVGSHADLVKSSQELKEKSSLVENIAKSRVKQQLTYGGFERMDCRLSKTKEARYFRSLLSTSQQAILSSQPSMNLYCHVLYAFLRTKLSRASCTLQELTTGLISEKDYSYRSSLLTESLTSLNDKGLILFIQNQEHPESSWVVVEKEALLREVNGTLFAPDNFKQYCQVASNTGIVPIATLEELFPQYSSEMLVGCLESMEFCHPVDMPTLQATNLKATLSFPLTGANYLFFPSLVKEHRPDDLPSPRFGWCLGCSDPHQYFSNRFLHVLLLRLAFTFPLASEYRSLSLPLHGLERTCSVWRNGICWKNVTGVSTIVEIVDLNRWVIVLVSEKTREAAKTCSSVIRMVLDLQHQLCRAVSTCECLISPSLLDHYPFDALPDTDLFTMRDVAKSMLLHYDLVLDRKEGQNEFVTKDALSCEPYYLLQPSSVCQLFNQSMASQPVPDPLLQEVLRYYQLPHQKLQDNSELKEWVNKHSIFAGRNPLVSCSVWIVL